MHRRSRLSSTTINTGKCKLLVLRHFKKESSSKQRRTSGPKLNGEFRSRLSFSMFGRAHSPPLLMMNHSHPLPIFQVQTPHPTQGRLNRRHNLKDPTPPSRQNRRPSRRRLHQVPLRLRRILYQRYPRQRTGSLGLSSERNRFCAFASQWMGRVSTNSDSAGSGGGGVGARYHYGTFEGVFH